MGAPLSTAYASQGPAIRFTACRFYPWRCKVLLGIYKVAKH
jgi:hypothetical protein